MSEPATEPTMTAAELKTYAIFGKQVMDSAWAICEASQVEGEGLDAKTNSYIDVWTRQQDQLRALQKENEALRSLPHACPHCNQPCESLSALREHSGACVEHPAVKEMQAVLGAIPKHFHVAVREGGAFENVAATLAVTVSGIVGELSRHRAASGHMQQELAVLRDREVAVGMIDDVKDLIEARDNAIAQVKFQTAMKCPKCKDGVVGTDSTGEAIDCRYCDQHGRLTAEMFVAAVDKKDEAVGDAMAFDLLSDEYADLEAETATLRADERRLTWFANNCGIDAFGDIDLHEAASKYMASEEDDDPERAFAAMGLALREAIDAAIERQKGGGG